MIVAELEQHADLVTLLEDSGNADWERTASAVVNAELRKLEAETARSEEPK